MARERGMAETYLEVSLDYSVCFLYSKAATFEGWKASVPHLDGKPRPGKPK